MYSTKVFRRYDQFVRQTTASIKDTIDHFKRSLRPSERVFKRIFISVHSASRSGSSFFSF